MNKVERAVAASKKDQDYKLKYAYDKLNKDAANRSANALSNKLLLNEHDKKLNEKRADIIAGVNTGAGKDYKKTVGAGIAKNAISPTYFADMILDRADMSKKDIRDIKDKDKQQKIKKAISGVSKLASDVTTLSLKPSSYVRGKEQTRYGDSNIANVIAGKDKKKGDK